MSPRQSVLELARRAAHLGWAVGDGGDIAVRNGSRVLVTPARPDKSHIYEEDLLLLEDGSLSGNTSPGASVAVPSALPVMLSILSDPQVGAVVHGHGVFSLLAAAAFPNGLRVRHLEMMARLTDGSDDEMHVVPVIANSRDARELARSLSVAKARNPDTCAVLVRNHGAFIWGRDAVAAKANMEIYDAMFQYVVEMRKLGIDDAIVDADEPEISTRRTVLPAIRTKTGSV